MSRNPGTRLRFLAAAFLLTFVIATPLGAQRGTARDTSFSDARVQAQARMRADSLRTRVLTLASFAGFSEGSRCTPGDFRTFERDTAGVAGATLRQLELLVLSYAAYQSLDHPDGRALLRAVVRLETSGPGPRWDVLTGTAPRAFNPQLPVRMLNPETRECVNTPGFVADAVILPEVRDFVVPSDSGATEFVAAYGPDGLRQLRAMYFTGPDPDSNRVLRHTRVTAHALWGEYAVVAVQRDTERAGGAVEAGESSGSAYAFHRVGGEWRLLAVIRAW